MSQHVANIPRRRSRPRTLTSHCLAALFGAAVTISFNSFAQVSPELMLGKLAPNDFQGLKNYLTFKANDYYGDRAKNQQKQAELEERLDQTTQSLAQLTQQMTQAIAQMTRSQNQMTQTTSQLTRSESQLNQHLAQTDQHLAQLQQRDAGSSAKQTNGTFTTPFTVLNGKRTVLKITSDDKGDVLMLGDGDPGAVKLTHSLKDGAIIAGNNPAGSPVVQLQGLKGGGKIEVWNSDGKGRAVSLANVGDGGTVQVFTKSSDTQVAELSGYGYGAVTTYKEDGTPTAVMGSRGGNGPAGVVGGSPMPASMIQGNGK